MLVSLAPPVVVPVPPVPDGPGGAALDAAQERAVTHRGPALLVRGAAGTGKTTTALEIVRRRVVEDGLAVEDVLLLAPTRRAADVLRDRLSATLRRTVGRPVVRTAPAAAFAVLRARAALLGEPAPILISGPEQDLVLAELLEGHRAGEGAAVLWPPSVPAAALGLRGFRDELRDLLMRAAERGLRPDDLRRLAERHARPEWAAAAAVYDEYLAVTGLRAGTPDAGARYDPAVVVDEAAEALTHWAAEVPGAPAPSWRLVVVDDHQESTAAGVRLLHALAAGGADLVLLADPDAAVQTFRGASPRLVEAASAPARSELGAFGATEVVLPQVWRHGTRLRAAVQAVTGEIRGTGRAQRAATAAARSPDADGTLQVRFLRSPAQEAAFVAHALRAAHLHDGLPWSEMAVVVRSGAHVADLRRALVGAHVPVRVLAGDVPLRAEPAVRPLLLAVLAALRPDGLTAEVAGELLVSPLGGLDAVGVRRLRRALRAEEMTAGGERTGDELLLAALADPDRERLLPGSLRGAARLARVLAAGHAAAVASGSTVLDVLWAVWSAAGLADPWRRQALAGGPAAARADRDLDAVLALFTAAEQFVDRMPEAPPLAFLEHLAAQDLPGDTLAARADGDAVELLTAAGAAGREWELVIVAGVQEGVWPDLRLRDSLLGAQALVDVLSGRAGGDRDPARVAAEARAAVLDDELRSFAVAVSRARRRLVVTAVQDTDHQPSGVLDLLDPGPAEGEPDHRPTTVPTALDLRAVVARCRAELERAATAGDVTAHPAARQLARLAAEGVPGADPAEWYGLAPLSTQASPWSPDRTVPLSPSALEKAATCSLRWALETAGGTAPSSGEQSLGTLVHAIAAEVPDGDPEALRARLEERWDELGIGDGWVGAVQRRRADGMVEHLSAYLRAAGEAVAVERSFQVRVGDVELRGTVDRVERLPDDPEDPDGAPRVRVVDLKTGRSAVSKEAAARHPQLGAYQAALDAGALSEELRGARCDGAALVYVGTTNRTPSERTQPALARDEDPEWAARLVADVAAIARSPHVSAAGNDLCRTCPVRRACPLQPEGQVVGR